MDRITKTKKILDSDTHSSYDTLLHLQDFKAKTGSI